MQTQLGVRVDDFPHLRMLGAGEEENLAQYIHNEMTGDEPLYDETEQVQDIDPIFAYREESQYKDVADTSAIEEEKVEVPYEFRWLPDDLNKLKKYS